MQHITDLMQDIMRREPELTDFGFGLFDGRKRTEDEYETEFKRNRKIMLEPRSLEQFERARLWLRRQRKIKHMNLSRSSYGLKHIAEPDIGYVTNGIFIAAAIAEGFRIYADGPNARFNIGKRLAAVPLPETTT
jgi:hypothetical protein